MVRRGLTVKVRVEQNPQSDTKIHYMAMGRELQVEGIANAQAMRHGCVGQVGGTAGKPTWMQ